jgi:hypothetical protein
MAPSKKKNKNAFEFNEEDPLNSLISESILREITGGEALTKRLNRLHEHLKSVEQDERPQGIEDAAAALVSPRLLEHKHKVFLFMLRSSIQRNKFIRMFVC